MRQRFHCSKCGVTYRKPRNAAYCKPCWAAYYAARRRADPERHRDCVRRCKAKYKAKYQAAENERYRRHPEKKAQKNAASYARRKGDVGDHTYKEWLAQLRAFGHRCAYCRARLTRTTRSRDHAIPLSRGGSNDISNIVPACRSCNSRKGARTAHEFVHQNGAVNPEM